MASQRPSLSLLPALLGACLATGCISYTLDRIPKVGQLPEPRPPAERPSVTWRLASVSGSDFQANSPEMPSFGMNKLSDEFGGSLLRTGLFRRVDEADDKRKADLQLEVVMTISANDTLIFASACTLFVIPTWRTVQFDLSVEARHADGRWQRYHFEDEVRDVHWLPLILGMSFAPWGDAYNKVRQNLYDTLLVHLAQDGFLVRSAGLEEVDEAAQPGPAEPAR